MIMRKILRSSLLLMTMSLSAIAAHGKEVKEITFDFFATGGGSTLVDATYFLSADELYHSRFAVGDKFMAGFEVPVNKLLSTEIAYTQGANNLIVTGIDFYPRQTLVYPVHNHMTSLDALAHSPIALFGIRPYAVAGVEYGRFEPTYQAKYVAVTYGFGATKDVTITGNDKMGLNIGIGLDRKIFRRVSFRLDLRDYVTSSPAFGLPHRSPNGAIFPVSGRANNLEYTAGFVIHIGKKK